MLEILHTIKTWRPYLLGRKFYAVRSTCQSNTLSLRNSRGGQPNCLDMIMRSGTSQVRRTELPMHCQDYLVVHALLQFLFPKLHYGMRSKWQQEMNLTCKKLGNQQLIARGSPIVDVMACFSTKLELQSHLFHQSWISFCMNFIIHRLVAILGFYGLISIWISSSIGPP